MLGNSGRPGVFVRGSSVFAAPGGGGPPPRGGGGGPPPPSGGGTPPPSGGGVRGTPYSGRKWQKEYGKTNAVPKKRTPPKIVSRPFSTPRRGGGPPPSRGGVTPPTPVGGGTPPPPRGGVPPPPGSENPYDPMKNPGSNGAKS